jgi:glycosyltransferase involved in cell wall biosynthesis
MNAGKIRILGNSTDYCSENWMRDTRIQAQEFRAPIFSVSEQLAPLRGVYHGTDLLWVPQYNIPLLYSGKVIVTIHDVCQLAHPEVLGSDLQRRYSRLLFCAVTTRAEAFMCDSEFTASEVQRFLSVERSRIVVIYPNIAISQPDMSPIRPGLGNGGGPYLLAVGNIKKHKNLQSLIAAFESIQGILPHRLVIVGKQDGFRNSEMALTNASTLMGGRVRFTGHITDQELRWYYQNAEALIFPSIYEGFGYPLVEAMAERCPIACSNLSSLPEVTAGSALLFDPFDVQDIAAALLRIATDQDLRTTLIESGLERVKHFQGESCAEQTAAVINRVFESS